MSGLKVLVVGASVAGPATAYWLAKAGAKVTVIERFKALRVGGQAVDIRTTGVSVMRKMPDMEAQVRAKSVKEDGLSFVRDDGTPYGVIRSTGNPDQQTIISEFEINRGDLSSILVGLTRGNENIEYVFDEQIASIEECDDGPITVEFTNRLPPTTYDLVVGCDGATSRTRAMGFRCGVRDHIVPTNVWAAYFTIQQDLLLGSKIGQGLSAPGGRFLSVASDAGTSKILLMSVHPKGAEDVTLPFREASSQGDQALKQYVAQRFQGCRWKSSTILQDMMHSEDFYASEIVQVRMPSWYKGRVVLVGDAGYASGGSGGGTSLALTGAYMLAGELHKQSDLVAGLQGYEDCMRPFVREMQKTPPFVNTILAPQSAWGIWIRNYAFALVAWTGLAEYAQRLVGGSAFASNDKFPIPEYDFKAKG
jgi:2-polyprenyl-6-methoxyphenol hydroxylase-like FAD-dependent oxidoreductase